MKSDLDSDRKAAVSHMKASAQALFLVWQGSDSKNADKCIHSPSRKASAAKEVLNVGYPAESLTEKELTDSVDG